MFTDLTTAIALTSNEVEKFNNSIYAQDLFSNLKEDTKKTTLALKTSANEIGLHYADLGEVFNSVNSKVKTLQASFNNFKVPDDLIRQMSEDISLLAPTLNIATPQITNDIGLLLEGSYRKTNETAKRLGLTKADIQGKSKSDILDTVSEVLKNKAVFLNPTTTSAREEAKISNKLDDLGTAILGGSSKQRGLLTSINESISQDDIKAFGGLINMSLLTLIKYSKMYGEGTVQTLKTLVGLYLLGIAGKTLSPNRETHRAIRMTDKFKAKLGQSDFLSIQGFESDLKELEEKEATKQEIARYYTNKRLKKPGITDDQIEKEIFYEKVVGNIDQVSGPYEENIPLTAQQRAANPLATHVFRDAGHPGGVKEEVRFEKWDTTKTLSSRQATNSFLLRLHDIDEADRSAGLRLTRGLDDFNRRLSTGGAFTTAEDNLFGTGQGNPNGAHNRKLMRARQFLRENGSFYEVRSNFVENLQRENNTLGSRFEDVNRTYGEMKKEDDDSKFQDMYSRNYRKKVMEHKRETDLLVDNIILNPRDTENTWWSRQKQYYSTRWDENKLWGTDEATGEREWNNSESWNRRRRRFSNTADKIMDNPLMSIGLGSMAITTVLLEGIPGIKAFAQGAYENSAGTPQDKATLDELREFGVEKQKGTAAFGLWEYDNEVYTEEGVKKLESLKKGLVLQRQINTNSITQGIDKDLSMQRFETIMKQNNITGIEKSARAYTVDAILSGLDVKTNSSDIEIFKAIGSVEDEKISITEFDRQITKGVEEYRKTLTTGEYKLSGSALAKELEAGKQHLISKLKNRVIGIASGIDIFTADTFQALKSLVNNKNITSDMSKLLIANNRGEFTKDTFNKSFDSQVEDTYLKKYKNKGLFLADNEKKIAKKQIAKDLLLTTFTIPKTSSEKMQSYSDNLRLKKEYVNNLYDSEYTDKRDIANFNKEYNKDRKEGLIKLTSSLTQGAVIDKTIKQYEDYDDSVKEIAKLRGLGIDTTNATKNLKFNWLSGFAKKYVKASDYLADDFDKAKKELDKIGDNYNSTELNYDKTIQDIGDKYKFNNFNKRHFDTLSNLRIQRGLNGDDDKLKKEQEEFEALLDTMHNMSEGSKEIYRKGFKQQQITSSEKVWLRNLGKANWGRDTTPLDSLNNRQSVERINLSNQGYTDSEISKKQSKEREDFYSNQDNQRNTLLKEVYGNYTLRGIANDLDTQEKTNEKRLRDLGYTGDTLNSILKDMMDNLKEITAEQRDMLLMKDRYGAYDTNKQYGLIPKEERVQTLLGKEVINPNVIGDTFRWVIDKYYETFTPLSDDKVGLQILNSEEKKAYSWKTKEAKYKRDGLSETEIERLKQINQYETTLNKQTQPLFYNDEYIIGQVNRLDGSPTEKAEYYKKLKERGNQVNKVYDIMGNTLTKGFTNMLLGVSGSLEESLTSMTTNIGSMLISTNLKSMLKGGDYSALGLGAGIGLTALTGVYNRVNAEDTYGENTSTYTFGKSFNGRFDNEENSISNQERRMQYSNGLIDDSVKVDIVSEGTTYDSFNTTAYLNSIYKAINEVSKVGLKANQLSYKKDTTYSDERIVGEFINTVTGIGNTEIGVFQQVSTHDVKEKGRDYIQDERGDKYQLGDYALNEKVKTVSASDGFLGVGGNHSEYEWFDWTSEDLKDEIADWNKWAESTGQSLSDFVMTFGDRLFKDRIDIESNKYKLSDRTSYDINRLNTLTTMDDLQGRYKNQLTVLDLVDNKIGVEDNKKSAFDWLNPDTFADSRTKFFEFYGANPETQAIFEELKDTAFTNMADNKYAEDFGITYKDKLNKITMTDDEYTENKLAEDIGNTNGTITNLAEYKKALTELAGVDSATDLDALGYDNKYYESLDRLGEHFTALSDSLSGLADGTEALTNTFSSHFTDLQTGSLSLMKDTDKEVVLKDEVDKSYYDSLTAMDTFNGDNTVDNYSTLKEKVNEYYEASNKYLTNVKGTDDDDTYQTKYLEEYDRYNEFDSVAREFTSPEVSATNEVKYSIEEQTEIIKELIEVLKETKETPEREVANIQRGFQILRTVR